MKKVLRGSLALLLALTLLAACAGAWKTAQNDRKGTVTARWKRVPGVTGYQVQYAADPAGAPQKR